MKDMERWNAHIVLVSSCPGLPHLLAQEGYFVLITDYGDGAKKAILNPMVNIGHDLCSLVVLDARTPGIDARLVAEEIRQLSDAPIIVYGQHLGIAMRGVHYFDENKPY